MTTTLRGKCSWFGGPADTGVAPDEGLAFIYELEDAPDPDMFLPQQPPGTTGLARRLNPDFDYVACRFDYDVTPKTQCCGMRVRVYAPKTQREAIAWAADWGPNESTGRIADISPGLMSYLGITTDDEVIVEFPYGQAAEEKPMPYASIAISSGHGAIVRGASGILDEVNEARKVTNQVAEELRDRGIEVAVFHDDESTTQSENLDAIVDWHNDQNRELDISVHFNAYVETTKPMGTEVLYVTQSTLAAKVSAAIASAGFIDRGAKKRTDLAFLNGTDMPAILLEVCFVDSTADADLYWDNFDGICDAIADVLGGAEEAVPPPEVAEQAGRVDIEISGNVTVTINGVPVTS